MKILLSYEIARAGDKLVLVIEILLIVDHSATGIVTSNCNATIQRKSIMYHHKSYMLTVSLTHWLLFRFCQSVFGIMS